MTSVGVDFRIKTIELNGHSIKLQIWDTAGQERYRTLTSSYYRGANGILLVYDVTNEKSFENIQNWLKEIEKHASANAIKVLIGAKCDIGVDKQVDIISAEHFASTLGIQLFETSSKDNVNIIEAFTHIVTDIMKHSIDTMIAPPPRDQHLDVDTETKDTDNKNQWCGWC